MQPPVYYYSVEISHLSGIAFGLTNSGGNKKILIFVGFKVIFHSLSTHKCHAHASLNHARFVLSAELSYINLQRIFFSPCSQD